MVGHFYLATPVSFESIYDEGREYFARAYELCLKRSVASKCSQQIIIANLNLNSEPVKFMLRHPPPMLAVQRKTNHWQTVQHGFMETCNVKCGVC